MKKTAAWHELAWKAVRVLKDDGIIRLFIVLKHYLFGMERPEGGLSKFTPSSGTLKKWRKSSRSFPYRPKISILLPIGSGNPQRLGATVDSVLNQAYDRWELCMAVDGAAQPYASELIDSYTKKDGRIRFQLFDRPLCVSDLSNAAIAMATGEFCGFLNPGDELTLSALYEVVHLLNINKTREADFIYSDEVLLDESGEPVQTLYRTDFSMDYLLSHCYIGHFSLVRTDLLHKIGGFRSELDASREYDLFLRIASETKEVGHIPKILYLRRQQDAHAGDAPSSEVMVADQRAIRDFLEREGIDAEVHAAEHAHFFRVQRRIIGNPKISIIIPTKDRVDLLKRCIRSIEEKTLYRNYEVIIVDNASRQADTLEFLAHLQCRSPIYRVVSFTEAFNFSRLNNVAVRCAVGEHLLFLNNDVEVITPGWLEAMLEHSQRDEVGCVGAKLLYPDGKIQHVGVLIGMYGGADHIYKGHDSD
ncbi:MAG: glycosyltransferase, partial [Thermodesulfobacteriota bacterium]